MALLGSNLDVQLFTGPPPLDATRPAHCPHCAAPSRPLGGPLRLHGHGVRTRQLRGPSAPDAPSEIRVLVLRRFRCVSCGGTCTVAPREVIARRLFSVCAIALAFALWGLARLPAPAVRAKVSPWTQVGVTAAETWSQLRRWARGPLAGPPSAGSLRDRAARRAQQAAGYAPPSQRARPLPEQAFLGASSLPTP